MAVLSITTVPPMVPLEQVLGVSAAIGAGGPPAGGISHAVVEDGGVIKVYDIFESLEALRAFEQDRLMPEIAKAMAARGIEGDLPAPEQQVLECAEYMATNAQG